MGTGAKYMTFAHAYLRHLGNRKKSTSRHAKDRKAREASKWMKSSKQVD